MKGIGPRRAVFILLGVFPPGRKPRQCASPMASVDVAKGRVLADHGAAATDFGFADLRVARFQHFRFGKLRFSFAE